MNVKKQKHRVAVLLILFTVAVLAGGGITFALHSKLAVNSNSGTVAAKISTRSSGESTASDDTSNSEIAVSDNGAKNEAAGSTTTPSSTTNIGVVIVDASQYGNTIEVRSYANTADSGSCTITFISGSSVITRQVSATPNASTSSCTTLDLVNSSFPKTGTWTVQVSYISASGTISGTSANQKITVN